MGSTPIEPPHQWALTASGVEPKKEATGRKGRDAGTEAVETRIEDAICDHLRDRYNDDLRRSSHCARIGHQ